MKSLKEAIINRADAEAIFKDAAYLRSKPQGLGRIFKGLRKDKVDVEDLRRAWADGLEPDGSDGYSNDTKDIKRILQKFGFGDEEINKVFSQVFRAGNEKNKKDYKSSMDDPVSSENVQKIANFAIKNGLQKQLLAFLEQEFPEELGIQPQKAVSEEIRQIFTAIVQEERTARARLIKEEEKTLIGRNRK